MVELLGERGGQFCLRFGDRKRAAARLRPGDVVDRHVVNGDIVLINRQPSLHTLSMMAHKIHVHDAK